MASYVYGGNASANNQVWESTDQVLSGIGRFVLLHPGMSGLVVLSVTLLTFWSNGVMQVPEEQRVFALSSPAPVVQVAPPMPAPPPPAIVALARAEEARVLEELATQPQWYVAHVQSGDTLATIFKRHHVSFAQALAISKLQAGKLLRNLKIGQEIRLAVNPDNTLRELHYAVGKESTLTIKRTSAGKFESARVHQPITALMVAEAKIEKIDTPSATVKLAANAAGEVPDQSAEISNKSTTTYVSGVIARSLYADARKAGLSPQQATQLGKMFAANGVSKKLRPGDKFAVLYAKSDKGPHQKKGDILLAQLSHKGQTYQSVRFTDPKGKTAYYDPKGKSHLPSITRAPIKHARVSSKFSHSRMHPVLHIRRPHLGVDYSARSGTPIPAAGAGVVSYRGYRGGYGNTIMIKHDKKHSTLYAHMSKFAKNIKSGSTVKEGQIIGYVGRTGLASGPHLHYEVHVNGAPKNPLTVALPDASIPSTHRRAFLAQARALMSELQLNQGTQFAKKTEGSSTAGAS